MKNRVLIIVENLPVPFDTRVWKEARTLKASGYDVTVLCPRGKNYTSGCEVLDAITIYRHPMLAEGNGLLGYICEYTAASFWQLLYTWWIFLSRGFDVIQGCNPPDTIVFIALPFKLFGVKYIFDHHDANPELYESKYQSRGLVYKLQLMLEKVTFRFADVVISTNESYRQLAMDRGNVDPRNVFVVRNGPDLQLFTPVPPNRNLKYGRPYLVGYVGTISVQEGLDILIAAAARIKALGRTDVHFTCIGGGPGLEAARQFAQSEGVAEIMNFTGRVPDHELIEILSTADVCVNPDKPCEMNDISTMIKIMEYMALGKPIVQFNLKEGRFSAGNASLYAANDRLSVDFADKILWLLDHPEERRTMGELGRIRVERELAWKYSEQNLLGAYAAAFHHDQHRDAASLRTARADESATERSTHAAG